MFLEGLEKYGVFERVSKMEESTNVEYKSRGFLRFLGNYLRQWRARKVIMSLLKC